jgi:hypothetical protein
MTRAALVPVLLTMLLTVGWRAAAQSTSSALVLLAGVGDYFGETYTPGPVAPATYVFFEGEPVTMDVRVANWGTRTGTLVTPAIWPRDLFDVRVSRNDAAAAVDVTFTEQTFRELIDGRSEVELQARMEIGPADALRWRADVGHSDLPPGLYRVVVQSHGVDTDGRALDRQPAEFVFEVRPAGDGEPAELARRVAERLTADGDFARAKEAVATLERTYPDSIAVHLIRSRIADAEGDGDAYAREIAQAREFLRSDRDRLFRKYARPGQIEDLADSLR